MMSKDSAPQFPQPHNLLAARSQLSFPLPALDEISAPGVDESAMENPMVTQTCDMLHDVNGIITKKLSTRREGFWYDVTFALYHLTPVMHSLLAIPRASMHDPLPFRRNECFRLACILYIANLQRKFDPEPGTGMLYGSKLKLMFDKEDIMPSSSSLRTLFLGILTVVACSSCLFTDLKVYLDARLREALHTNEFPPSESLSRILNGEMWCREAFQKEMHTLTSELMS